MQIEYEINSPFVWILKMKSFNFLLIFTIILVKYLIINCVIMGVLLN